MKPAALLVPVAGVLAGGFGGAAALVPAAQPCAAATYGGHVTLVVEHGDTRVIGLCIGFDGSSITGEQILQASGLEYGTQSYGPLGDAVCQLDSEPASYGACLPAGGSYWAMVVSRSGGPWQTADLGISTETFGSGDAEGFRYESQSGPEPRPASPAGICARALAGSAASPPAATGPSSAAGGPVRATGYGGGAASPASPAGTVSQQPAAATPGPSSAPAVISPAGGTSLATVGTRHAGAASGPDAALLAACAALGAIAGLVVLRLVRRRRARAP